MELAKCRGETVVIPVIATNVNGDGYECADYDGSAGGRVFITGAGGVVSRALSPRLAALGYRLIGLDVVVQPEELAGVFGEWVVGSVADYDTVVGLIKGCEFVVHLATGAGAGWSGLCEVEVQGTRNVLEGAVLGGVRRVVLASSNHVVGAGELEALASNGIGEMSISAVDPPRPDGLYGSAKVFVEALGRSVSEIYGLGVSAIRIGTVRTVDDPHAYVDSDDFAYVGSHDEVRERLERTWLYHDDLVLAVCEEFEASETFRVRFLTSQIEQKFWVHTPAVWTRTAQ